LKRAPQRSQLRREKNFMDRYVQAETDSEIAQAITNRLKTMPLHLTVPMSQLAPGDYKCQVSVLDPNGQKAAFWVGPVVVVE
jgi:hypothetical protein